MRQQALPRQHAGGTRLHEAWQRVLARQGSECNNGRRCCCGSGARLRASPRPGGPRRVRRHAPLWL